MTTKKVSRQASRLIKFFLFAFLCILVRVWYLSVVAYDDAYAESKRPLRRMIVDRPERGTIRDRFNVPLAQNRVKYNAAICYADIRQIPSVTWKKDALGKKKRILARREYIEELANFLGDNLGIPTQTIEDTIHGKASLFPHTPFVLKEDISEDLYCKLKMCERKWLGIHMQRTTERVYPRGKTACDVIGYIGSIGDREYKRIGEEIQLLQNYLREADRGKAPLFPKGFASQQEVETRLALLEKKAYSIQDQVGKCGVEKSFDELLRGERGKQIYEIGLQKGTRRILPGTRPAKPGERLILSISAELQEEAEKLLSEYELLQEERDKMSKKTRRTPWQRGGAIVAMIPQTGEIVAFASYPRFDPNDFVPAETPSRRKEKTPAILKWLENEQYIGAIWDGKKQLERERYSSREGTYYTEMTALTWPSYLKTILPEETPLYNSIASVHTIGEAIEIQKTLSSLLEISGAFTASSLIDLLYGDLPVSEATKPLKASLDPYLLPIAYKRDKLLFLDLIRLAVYAPPFTTDLLKQCSLITLDEHRLHAQALAIAAADLKESTRKTFHDGPFQEWRKKHFRAFLTRKRKEERAKGSYAKPYVDYLEKEEKAQFAAYWETNKWDLLRSLEIEELTPLFSSLTPDKQTLYLQSLRPFNELTRPLLSTYPHLRKTPQGQLEKHLASAFYPYSGFGYGRSEAYRTATPMGSLFKLIPSYAALMQQVRQKTTPLNPLTLVDDMQWTAKPGSNSQVLGYHTNGEEIKRFYKGGRLPRAYPGIGKIDLVSAIERTSNMYFSILAGDFLYSPSDLLTAATTFGLGKKTGIELPYEYSGKLPTDISYNKTGLYAFAIGQHSLVTTPLQAATALSALANGGKLLKPQIVKLSAGAHLPAISERLFTQPNYPHKQALSLLGIPYPLFTHSLSATENGYISFRAPETRATIPLPKEVQDTILEGMRRVPSGARGTARPELIRKTFHTPAAYASYRRNHKNLAGKTGTAEILYKQTIDSGSKAQMEKHVWFGGISYVDDQPDLVVVTYLRFGSAGKQGAPIATRIAEKWRELKKSH